MDEFDIFINGGSQHFEQLKDLLPKLHPFGRVHFASISLDDREIQELAPHFDVLHRPSHDTRGRGYFNHLLYCTREINALATGKWFVKTDADTSLRDDWFEYVEKGTRERPDAALFGVRRGLGINVSITGELARRRLGADVRIERGKKVCGAFYVGNTAFFKQHDRLHQDVHELVYCFGPGGRNRPSHRPESWTPEEDALGVRVAGMGSRASEDTTRSIVVHAVGAADRMCILGSDGRVGQERL